MTYLGHDSVLTAADVGAISLDNSLQELEVLCVVAIGLNAVDKLLHQLFSDLITQLNVVFEDGTNRLCLNQLHLCVTVRLL